MFLLLLRSTAESERRNFNAQRTSRFLRASARLALLIVVLLAAFPQHVWAAGGSAPSGPGLPSNWTPSNNTILGTAANTTSDIWFTGYNGIIGEVFYPTADTPNTTDLQFLVGDSGHTWVDEEKVATTSSVQLYDNHSLAWVITNTAASGKYRITKTVYTDPSRSSLIQQVTFTALSGTLANYLLYLLYNPAMHDAGNINTSSSQVFNGSTVLVTTDSSGAYASALGASLPFVPGMTSSGFVGVNDGWTDLKGSSNCGSGTCPDFRMSFTYGSANNGNTAQTGQLDLSNGGTVNTQTATSITFSVVLSFGTANGATSSMASAEQTLASTLSGNVATLLSTYVAQWHNFDNGLKAPPAVGSTTAIQQARQQEYYLAANVVSASQDKQTGAFVAGLGTPWGATNGDGDNGYHLVWERDMYEFSSALIVAGDTADPKRALAFAFNAQQPQSNGHFPQNSFVNGAPFWTGIQMDEQAYPIILAWKLGVTDSTTYQNSIKPAANYILNNGPFTMQERWEENAGYSPSTIAAEIAGLVCAADVARMNGDTASQTLYDNAADYWQAMVQNWTFTTTGPLGGHDYFERIDKDGNPNDGAPQITIANTGGAAYDERSIVDAGFLELVRQGVLPSNSPYIGRSLPVIDSTIEQTINGNSYFYRYNHDGYGEHADGSAFNGTGIGRLWPILSGERGVYTIAAGGSADPYLTAMTAAANASGLLPEQVFDGAAPPGDTPGTPTNSMNPLNWAMGEYITLLSSAATNTIADVPAIVPSRYVAGAYQPRAGQVVDYNSSQLNAGKALTIFYRGSLASGSSVFMHWGENSWQNIPTDQALVQRADGFWQTTISIPNDAAQINFAFNNGAGSWDNNNGQNWNLEIGGSCPAGPATSNPCSPVHGKAAQLFYNGPLAAGASSITVHWGYNSWNGVTDTVMTRQSNGPWTAFVMVPASATQLNMAFNASIFNPVTKTFTSSWDNNGGQNYSLSGS
jgi:glucoamylase